MTAPPRAVYRRLLAAYGAQGWWPVTVKASEGPVYRPDFRGALTERQRAEVCVGAILTQNTNWRNVETALRGLHRAGVWDLGRLASWPPRRVERLVRPSGYFRQKAKKLRLFARHAVSRGTSLRDWLSGPLEALRAELLSLWGVGPETADSILLYAGGRPSFVVDAYTVRIGRRIGWFRRHDYAHVQRFFTGRLPASPRDYAELHALFVELAKRHCRSAPVCSGCPLREVCHHGRSAASGA
ncbi:MAG: endonuclease III domain-containing protein [Elusimicrobia bacterium]|nr:endonuclease III domain-containing protein [Elusimicrobiota bacterium]